MSLSVRSLPTAADSTSNVATQSVAKSDKRLALAAHVLRAMATAQVEGRRLDLDGLAAELGVSSDDDAPLSDGVRARRLRREDVRAMVSQLDGEGFVDASRMRLTFAGFAMGSALSARKVMPLRLV